jgi:hypothetical protein
MRLSRLAMVPSLALVAACSSDRREPTGTILPLPVHASVELAFSGSSPLFNSRANAINDSAVVVGFGTLSAVDVSKAAVWAPPSYAFAFLPGLGTHGASVANAIARDGTVGGQACEDSGACHPVFWRAGTIQQLDGVGQVNAICSCDSHTMIGEVLVDGVAHGALWVDEVLIDVGVPTGFTNATLVSVAHGNIVGNAFNGTPATPGPETGFRWAPSSGWTQLDGTGPANDVNSSGTAVGVNNVMWATGSSTATPIPDGSTTTAVNDSGMVAGTFRGDNPFDVPGTWTLGGGWVMVGANMNPTVTAINNPGAVVGFFHDQGEDFAELWQP